MRTRYFIFRRRVAAVLNWSAGHRGFMSVAIFVLAALPRARYAATAGPISMGDTGWYFEIARNLIRYHMFSMVAPSPQVSYQPGYPVFLAPFLWLHLGSASVVGVQIVLSSLTAALAYRVALASFGPGAGLVAGLYCCFYPDLIGYSAALMNETLATFLLSAAVAALIASVIRAARSATPAWRARLGVLGAGALFGLAQLTRQTALGCLLLAAALLCWPRLASGLALSPARRQWLAAALLLGAFVVMGPYWIRTSRLTGQHSLLIGPQGPEFYMATLPVPHPWDEGELWPLRYAYNRAHPFANPRQQAEVWQGMYAAGWRNIRADPGLYLRNRLLTWPHLFLDTFETRHGLSLPDSIRRHLWGDLAGRLGKLLVFSVVPLLLAAIGSCYDDGFAARYCGLTCAAFALFMFPMLIEERYWVPMVPLVAIAAAAGVNAFVRRLTVASGLSAAGVGTN